MDKNKGEKEIDLIVHFVEKMKDERKKLLQGENKVNVSNQ